MPKDCNDLCEDGQTSTGVYDIYPYGTLTIPVNVFCDMSTMGGGWTVIQKRVDGSVSFDRNLEEYKNGFGSPERNVWNGTTLYEMYDGFSVSDETGKYQLFLAGPATGTLGDAMLDTGVSSADLSGMYFSTQTEITTSVAVTVLLTVAVEEVGGLTPVTTPSL
ncbi:microfibril-associated glycoprotein 4-like [Saccostrea cucullata]|uniref:microfibril-associated glycoprotein 4-like n=1 Tax=Saccostrea cuccullata TaxID=36930 RepID=UPI002ED0D3F7